MLALERVAERRILEAIEAGELDGLPGRGRALALDDDSAVPPELRAAYRVLRNAGMVPEGARLLGDVAALERLVGSSADPGERADGLRRMALLRARLEAQGLRLSSPDGYEERLRAKLAR